MISLSFENNVPVFPDFDRATLGSVLLDLKSKPQRRGSDIIERDIILVWDKNEKRVITGADILDRLLRGI